VKRRALTLVEVLASVVILTMLTVACLPLLRDAAHGLERTEPDAELFELSRLADEVVEDPEAFGIGALESVEQVQISWPEEPGREPVDVSRLQAQSDEVRDAPDHCWLVFRCGGRETLRYLPMSETESAK